jgi:hypothetical protein
MKVVSLSHCSRLSVTRSMTSQIKTVEPKQVTATQSMSRGHRFFSPRWLATAWLILLASVHPSP